MLHGTLWSAIWYSQTTPLWKIIPTHELPHRTNSFWDVRDAAARNLLFAPIAVHPSEGGPRSPAAGARATIPDQLLSRLTTSKASGALAPALDCGEVPTPGTGGPASKVVDEPSLTATGVLLAVRRVGDERVVGVGVWLAVEDPSALKWGLPGRKGGKGQKPPSTQTTLGRTTMMCWSIDRGPCRWGVDTAATGMPTSRVGSESLVCSSFLLFSFFSILVLRFAPVFFYPWELFLFLTK